MELLTTSEVTKRYGFSRNKLQELRDTGQISYIQYCPGGKIFFRPSDVESYISRCVHPARPVKSITGTYRKQRATRAG